MVVFIKGMECYKVDYNDKGSLDLRRRRRRRRPPAAPAAIGAAASSESAATDFGSMLVRTGSGKPAPPTRLRQSASPLRVKASVIGPKAVPVRAAADKTSGKVGSVKAGEEVTILELQRTPSGTTRVRTQCGWTTAQTKQGRRLLEVDGDLEELLMRDLFRKVDADKDGRLDAAQLERFVASLAPGQPVDPASHAAMMEEIG
eukprot:COSAG01_NODE_29622_length_633_cov_1.578652_1_plen_201_part_01